jgi:ADP-heptose:LPS heptosyltransferase
MSTQPRRVPPQTIRRIAVVRALQLGDLLVALPALRALRARFPRAEITLIGLPWAAAFVERFARYVDRFVAFPGWPGIAEATYGPKRTGRFLAEQRAYGYDLVIQMHGGGGASNPFALALGGRITAGYYEGGPPAGLTLAAPYPDDEPEVLRNLGLARLVGCRELDPRLEFPLHTADRAEARELLRPLARSRGVLVGIHAGARPPARRWPPERFAAVADALARHYGARIVLTGGPDEVELMRAVADRMHAPALNLASETSLGGLAALLHQLDLFIGNDTGPAHLAYAVGVPSITLFGPADVRRWAPLDQARHRIVRVPVACSPCGYWECPIDHRCLRWIVPEMVLAVAEGFLAKGAIA